MRGGPPGLHPNRGLSLTLDLLCHRSADARWSFGHELKKKTEEEEERSLASTHPLSEAPPCLGYSGRTGPHAREGPDRVWCRPPRHTDTWSWAFGGGGGAPKDHVFLRVMVGGVSRIEWR